MEEQPRAFERCAVNRSTIRGSWIGLLATGVGGSLTTIVASALLSVLLLASPAAHAVDGCKVLLCLAGNWSNISQCRPDVEQAFRDVARGRGWPTCGMGGSSSAQMQWASEATCPPFYSYYNPDNGSWSGCQYDGMVSVRVNSAPWSDLFWSSGGGSTSTRYYDPARAALGTGIDPKYDQDSAAYVTPAPAADPGPVGGG